MSALIEARELCKQYQKGWRRPPILAVDRVSFCIHRGEIFGFLGPNGSGKTTTVKMLCGLVTPSSGTALINGIDVVRKRSAAVRQIGGVLEGNRNLYWRLSALENMQYYTGVRGIPFGPLRVKALELLDLFHLIDRKNDPVRRYSRGMQQRLAVAISLLTDPEILLLDEPTLGLDVDSTRIMMEQIRQLARSRNIAVFLTTHQMPVAQELCDRIAIMHRGRLLCAEQTQKLLFTDSSPNIRVLFTAPIPAVEQLTKRIPAGITLRRENGHLLAEGLRTSSQTIFQLFAILDQAGAELLDLSTTGHDLESVYLQLLDKEPHHVH